MVESDSTWTVPDTDNPACSVLACHKFLEVARRLRAGHAVLELEPRSGPVQQPKDDQERAAGDDPDTVDNRDTEDILRKTGTDSRKAGLDVVAEHKVAQESQQLLMVSVRQKAAYQRTDHEHHSRNGYSRAWESVIRYRSELLPENWHPEWKRCVETAEFDAGSSGSILGTTDAGLGAIDAALEEPSRVKPDLLREDCDSLEDRFQARAAQDQALVLLVILRVVAIFLVKAIILLFCRIISMRRVDMA
ncbi:hypothetical protein NliqN6_1822 [Naganishia liquefaciens]|uniref:Uncharacterized protein n=1 Tax=Naganishia liquefaciens TaxID=104408 RepID=A0A8H3YDG8_9TREE|nr:hypothetical protein NliqN6_1822 [Naganishia liquefaciens]